MTKTPSQPDIGDATLDGIYAGTSPSTGGVMYTTPEDIGVVDVLHAEALIKNLNTVNAYGHNDWRLPDEPEKNTLLNAKHKGHLSHTFNERPPLLLSGRHRTLSNLYLSTNHLADDPHHAGHMRMEDDDGYQTLIDRKSGVKFAIRPVRTPEP